MKLVLEGITRRREGAKGEVWRRESSVEVVEAPVDEGCYGAGVGVVW